MFVYRVGVVDCSVFVSTWKIHITVLWCGDQNVSFEAKKKLVVVVRSILHVLLFEV